MEIYNTYIKVPIGGLYESEFCFVESFDDFNKNFLSRDEHWVVFKDEYKKETGYYQLDFGVNHFFGKVKDDFLQRYEDKISDISSARRYYAYIKIINDNHNPQLNGQIMLFKYGRRIHETISGNPHTTFSKSFLLRVILTQGFPNYDSSKFSDKNYYIRDINLNIRNIPSLKRLDIVRDIERKFKLNKITKKIKDKDNEKICM